MKHDVNLKISSPYDPRRARSVSQLNSYTRCSLAYFLERVQKAPSPPAAWTIKGNAVHQTIELWEDSGRTTDWQSLYTNSFDLYRRKALERYPDLTQWVVTPRVKTAEQDLKLREAEGMGQLATFISRAEAEVDLWEPYRFSDGSVAVELPFKLDFGSDVPFFLLGYIDVIKYWKADGTLTVGDYKTGAADRENFRQLGTYRVALADNYGIDVRYGEYWYTKLDRSSGWVDLSRYTKSYLYDVYDALDRGINDGVFIANPSVGSKGICNTCAVKPYCEEMKGR